MRTLSEITAAVRRDEAYTEDELVYSVVAYDVLLAQLDLPAEQRQLKQWFEAAESDPRKYVGWANDPGNPAAVDWYSQHVNMPNIIAAARRRLAEHGGAPV